jgi:hypothetical protein
MKRKAVLIVAVAVIGAMLALPAPSPAWRGWWGPGVFAGGVLLGTALTAPYYYPPPPPPYYYPAPQVVYGAPPPAEVYGYPSLPPTAYPSPPPAAQSQTQGPGRWVDVPGQMVSNTWVPPHKVWVPDNAANQPPGPPSAAPGE